jgi:hypothetical protein
MLIHSRKIAQWPDPLTPPKSTTECIAWASGDWPWPATGGWKTCSEWKTTWSHVEVEAFLDFNGPDDIVEDAKNAVIDCALVAAAAGGAVGFATDGALVVAAAQTAFLACLGAKGVAELDKYSVSFRTDSHWT